MKKLLLIIILSFLITGNLSSKDYRAGEEIENQVELDKVLKMNLSPGTWTVIEKNFWDWSSFSGNYIFLAKITGNEVSEYYRLSYLNTAGKYISDINAWLYRVIYKDKYDGCYQRPEYYLLELFNKGSTTNCLIVRHIDVKKELYNPDDKANAWVDEPLRRWIDDNSIQIPNIMLRSEHIIFARTSSSKLYVVVHGINPKFFNGPKNKFITEDTSEYHPVNIKKFQKHKKFMNDFIKSASLKHMELENRIKIKKYQKLDLVKYNPEKKIIKNTANSNKNNQLSSEDIKKLKDLKKLLDEGILTQQEFNSEKKKILK